MAQKKPFWYLRRRSVKSEVDEELSLHLEMRIDELVRDGMSRDDARREALRQFGDLEGTRKYCLQQDEEKENVMQRALWFDDFMQDLRIGVRSLLRAPLLTLTIVVTVGLGATAAIFSAVSAARSTGRSPDEPVFRNRRRAPITRFVVHATVTRYGTDAAVSCPSLAKKAISPHVIRHTTATHLLRAGVDINTIRAWLGHVSIDTTNVYAEVDLETKAQMLAACGSFTAGKTSSRRWRDDPSLMQFLRSL